jgi:hypothetical protein
MRSMRALSGRDDRRWIFSLQHSLTALEKSKTGKVQISGFWKSPNQ